MDRMHTQFDPQKAVELILYIASRLGRDTATFHTISKICYFSDLLHLERYGRLITFDGYVAMKHGPVPSRIYDLLKKDDYHGFKSYAENAFDLADAHHVVPRREAQEDYLSSSEKECLNLALEKYGRMSFKQLSDASHKGAWNKADTDDFILLDDMVAMLPNSAEVRAHLLSK